jgi:hypothetical protein
MNDTNIFLRKMIQIDIHTLNERAIENKWRTLSQIFLLRKTL